MRKYKRQVGDPRRDYGKEWKQWRLEHKMTQGEVAQASGLSAGTIYAIEAGYKRPQLRSRLKFKAMVERYEEESQWQQQSKSLNL